MELTGEPNGSPLVFGLPMVDLGAAEHAYGAVMKALYKRALSGEGSRIDISMLHSAAQWMISPLMLTALGEAVTRRGNTHQFFAPVSVYPTSDGFVYLAVGNDRQWEALTATSEFALLACDEYMRNAGRSADAKKLNTAISEIMRTRDTGSWLGFFNSLGVPASRVSTVREVMQDELMSTNMISACDSKTGATIQLPAPVVVPSALREQNLTLSFPPRLGQDNARVYGALGYDADALRARGVI